MDEAKDIDLYRRSDKLMKVFRRAVRRAQKESRSSGVANVFVHNGQRYSGLPNGSINRISPIDDQ